MKKIKRGSSLISVVMIFSILFIVGTSIIAVTVSDYKMRINTNQKVKNLYGADSGLEEAYAKLGALIDEAVLKANEEVDTYNKELNAIIDEERDKLNKNKNYVSEYVNKDGSLKDEYIYNKKNLKFKDKYKQWIKEQVVQVIEKGNYLEALSEKPTIEILSKVNDRVNFDEKEEMSLEVQSSFKDKDIDRIIKTTFNVKTPDYKKTETYKSAKIPVKSAWSKSFVAGKDFIDRSNVDILGDIYVLAQGDEGKGVLLDSSYSKLSLNGKLVSLKDIRLQEINSEFKVESTEENDVDISKIYTGILSIDKNANNSLIDINGQVYANNDLSLNAEKSKINITKGFYGINDIGTKENAPIGSEAKNSSCIIVNTSDIGKGSSITIGNEAILMGTAYINVDTPYQTGESVGIKGNYRAYGSPLSKGTKFNENNVNFEYRNPLQLVTKFKNGEALLYNDKGQYIAQYIEENKAVGINKGEGISLPENTIHVGAIFNKGDFKLLGYTTDNDGKVSEEKGRYNTATSEIKAIEEEIDFSKINNRNEAKVYTDGTEIIYLNDTEKDCVLLGTGGSNAALKDADIIDISSSNNRARGIIITKGNVYVRGQISEFKGTIIAGGNIVFEDSNPKNFIYDKDYIKRFVAANYPIFKNIFIGKNLSTEVVQWEVTSGGEINLTGGFVRQKLLSSKSWKIIK